MYVVASFLMYYTHDSQARPTSQQNQASLELIEITSSFRCHWCCATWWENISTLANLDEGAPNPNPSAQYGHSVIIAPILGQPINFSEVFQKPSNFASSALEYRVETTASI
jgi:hypothetical protein